MVTQVLVGNAQQVSPGVCVVDVGAGFPGLCRAQSSLSRGGRKDESASQSLFQEWPWR